MKILTVLSGDEKRTFGRSLRAAIIEDWIASGRGTRAELAEKLYWHNLSRLKSYEDGSIFPSVDTLLTIAETTGISPVSLLHAAGYWREVIHIVYRVATLDATADRTRYADAMRRQASKTGVSVTPLLDDLIRRNYRAPGARAIEYAEACFRLRDEDRAETASGALRLLSRERVPEGTLNVAPPRLPRLLRLAAQSVGLSEVPASERRFIVAELVRAWARSLPRTKQMEGYKE